LTDGRSGYGSLEKPLINVANALQSSLAPPTLSSTYTINGTDIELDGAVQLSELLSNLSTPYGYQVKNSSSTTVYSTAVTPYASTAPPSLIVGDGWTIDTLSYPIDSYSPSTYTIQIQAEPAPDPDDPSHTDLRVTIESVLELDLDKNNLHITLSPNDTDGSDKLVVSVDTNSINGYTASLSASQPSLVCQTKPSLTIAPLANAGNLVAGRWGYGVGTVSAPPSAWQPVSLLSTVFDSSSTLPTSTAVSYLYVGSRASMTTPAPCADYETLLTITAIAGS
jgi:hypothetical protein